MGTSTKTAGRPPYWPFVRADENLECDLFWIGIPAFPMPSAHRAWLSDFSARFSAAVEKEFAIRSEFFLEFKTVIEIEPKFRKLAAEVSPWPGLSRKPGAVLPKAPTRAQMEAILKGAAYDVRDFFPDTCFWLRADHGKLMAEFFGYGGASMFFLPPDPAAQPPKIPYIAELRATFPQIEFEKLFHMMQATCSLRESFLSESKKLFGDGLQNEPSWEGISFILPLLETRDFFAQPAAEKKKWFQVFDLFWRESPPDNGLYIASKHAIAPVIAEVVQSMIQAGHLHPEDRPRP